MPRPGSTRKHEQYDGPSWSLISGGVAAFVEYLAIRYGAEYFAWFASLIFAVVVWKWLRSKIKGFKLIVLPVCSVLIIGGATWYWVESSPNFDKLPGLSIHAVINMLDSVEHRRKYIADFGGIGNGEVAIYVSEDGIFTLSLISADGEAYNLSVPFGEGVPANEFIYLVCDVGLGHDRTEMRISVNGKPIDQRIWKFKIDAGPIVVAGGVLGADLHQQNNGPFLISSLAVYYSTLSEVDRENLKKHMKGEYGLDISLNRYLEIFGLFKPLPKPASYAQNLQQQKNENDKNTGAQPEMGSAQPEMQKELAASNCADILNGGKGSGGIVTDSLVVRSNPSGNPATHGDQTRSVPMVESTGNSNGVCVSNSTILNTTATPSSILKSHGDDNALVVKNVTVANGSAAVAATAQTKAAPERSATWWSGWLDRCSQATEQTAVSELLMNLRAELGNDWKQLPAEQQKKNDDGFKIFRNKLLEASRSNNLGDTVDYYRRNPPPFLKLTH